MVKELRNLSKSDRTDRELALSINRKFHVVFSAIAIKKKRHRLNLLKKKSKIVSNSKFRINVSRKKSTNGFTPAIFPLTLIKKFGIKNNEIRFFKLNENTFPARISKRARKDRKSDNFIFYVPYHLLENRNSAVETEISILPFMEDRKTYTNSKLIQSDRIDILTLFKIYIKRKRVHCLIAPDNKNKLWIWIERESINIVPRYINPDKELFRLLGLIQGDGTKTHDRRLEFSNSDPNLINLFIDYLGKNFNVSKSKWGARIVYTNKIRDSTLEKTLINHWTNKTEIPKENFVKTKWYEGTPDAKRGSLQLYLCNSIYRELFIGLLDTLPVIEMPYARWFMQGVFASDGCPILRKGKLHEVDIRTENLTEGRLYSCALGKEGIMARTCDEGKIIRISGKENFNKIITNELFILHKERLEKFMNGS